MNNEAIARELALIARELTSSKKTAWTDKVDNRVRPPRMKKPKVTPSAHRYYREYVQDLLHNLLVDKYGTERGTKTFDYLIAQDNRAMYTVGQDIQDEKAQMYMDLKENLPGDYWHESYFDVWQRWMVRPPEAKAASAVGSSMVFTCYEIERIRNKIWKAIENNDYVTVEGISVLPNGDVRINFYGDARDIPEGNIETFVRYMNKYGIAEK